MAMLMSKIEPVSAIIKSKYGIAIEKPSDQIKADICTEQITNNI